MNRLWTAALAGMVAASGGAWAEPGGPTFVSPPPAMGLDGIPGEAGPTSEDVYGCHPTLRKLFFWRKSGNCKPLDKPIMGPYGQLPGTVPPHAPAGAGVPGPGMPGTLVFPHHPYFRSPRDFFMWEPGMAP